MTRNFSFLVGMTYKANITQRNKHPIQREAEKLIPLPPFSFSYLSTNSEQ